MTTKPKTVASPPMSDVQMRRILSGEVTELAVKIKQANDKLDGPASAVCQCDYDGSWIAWWGIEASEGWQKCTQMAYPDGGGFRPPVAVGDVLWFREAFALWNDDLEDGTLICYRSDGRAYHDPRNGPHYRTDGVEAWLESDFNPLKECDGFVPKWIGAQRMPQWASRERKTITRISAANRENVWYWIYSWV